MFPAGAWSGRGLAGAPNLRSKLARLSSKEATVSSPDFVERDPRHPERTRSYKGTAAFGGRVLRVEHRPEGDDS